MGSDRHNMRQGQRLSDQIKQPDTLDVRFDKRSEQNTLNQHALERYQQNAYLFGRIFSNSNENFAQQAQEDEWQSCDDDDILGLAMTELKTSLGDDLSNIQTEDQETQELLEYLNELREQFK